VSFIFFWNGIYLVEFIILMIQRRIGGRFFLPECIVKDNNGYYLMKEVKV
jgi:hypothetical protein